ncbi:MAG: response regulator [Proteobacteria bacterium]|nr:response regulator [Pseudomonadota bacterium]MBU1744466.1 response regulator [Pseudomonadota bacterium]MBU1965861.1 response regulator [Pseudomonadota bacterium]
MKKALIVDDNEQNLYLLQTMLKGQGYDVRMAANGAEALEQARRDPPDIVISDVLMPVMDGFALCREWRKDERLQLIPFVFYTATYTDPNDEELALSLGAARFVVKPRDPEAFTALLQQVIEGRETGRPVAPVQPAQEETDYYKLYNEALIRKLEDKMLALEESNRALEQEITVRKKAEASLQESHATLEKNLKGTIDVLSETIEKKGPYAPGHHRRAAALASAIAREMGLSDFQVQGIELAAAVYDIGLMNVPPEFLQDTNRLEGIKLTLYQGYPQAGHDALKKIEFPWPIADIILQHRECFDGSGFPQGLKREAILIEARVLAVAGALDNLTVHRSYRNALPMDEALAAITKHSGFRYDPDVVAACQRLILDDLVK